VFVKGRGLTGRSASGSQIDHPHHGDVAARRQGEDIADSDQLTGPFHGSRIDPNPSFCAVGAGDGSALAKPRKPEPLVDPAARLFLVHVGTAPPDLGFRSFSTANGDDKFLFFPIVCVLDRL